MARKKDAVEGSAAVAEPKAAPAPEPKKPSKVKIPKLAAKNKSRLPRRLKKAQQKASRNA